MKIMQIMKKDMQTDGKSMRNTVFAAAAAELKNAIFTAAAAFPAPDY